MSRAEKGDRELALKLVHTADWHLGMRFPSFDEEDQKKLSRERLSVIDRILGVAERNAADAVLCAGDLFDEPSPAAEWWQPLADLFRRAGSARPVFLLPGNHDPLTASSVWSESHPFRSKLPSWVHVVDRDNYTFALNEHAILHAAPCRSAAGQNDLALALPARAPGDERIRIGMVHGSTFDLPGHQTNFPIASNAAELRGFDYLAIGDTHSFRLVPPNTTTPTVYPGAPETTTFGEPESGNVALVFVTLKRRVNVRPERVAYWRWQEQTVTTLEELQALKDGADLSRTVLRLIVDLALPPAAYAEAEEILRLLKGTEATAGRAGVLQLEERRLELDTTRIEDVFDDLPEVLKTAAARLKEKESGPGGAVARKALYHLYTLARRAG